MSRLFLLLSEKRKEFVPLGSKFFPFTVELQSNFFPFRVEPFLEGG